MDQDNRNDVVDKFELHLGLYSKKCYIIHYKVYGSCANSYVGNKCGSCGILFPQHLVIQRDLFNGK